VRKAHDYLIINLLLNMKKIIVLMFCVTAVLGCSRRAESEYVLLSEDSVTEKSAEYNVLAESKSSSNEDAVDVADAVNAKIAKKIIKDGSLSIQTENLKNARAAIDSLLKKTNSYLQSENYTNDYYTEEYTMVLRIESKNFDTFLSNVSIDKIGKITEKSVTARDVTEDYYDTAIRLKNKELYLEKYREFLKQSKTVADMLEVQEKIRNMEEEIESAKGRLRFIDDRVNYSTINLRLYYSKPQAAISAQMGFGRRIGNALTNGWNLIVEIVIDLITIWPLILIAIPVIYFIRKWRKKRKANKLK
jgi:uncharacterized lipoprotein NlpE involved in copper resistance